MSDLAKIEKRFSKVEHGFTEMKAYAKEYFSNNEIQETFNYALELYSSNVYQVRMIGVFLLGMVASKKEEALEILKMKVVDDSSWQVQEILAQAFDNYAKEIGYEKSLKTIKVWLKAKNPNCRRAVTEGLRIWTSREYFKEHPEVAIKLLSALRDDESDYVRRSVGNALRDISKRFKKEIKEELGKWDLDNKNVLEVYKLASKFI